MSRYDGASQKSGVTMLVQSALDILLTRFITAALFVAVLGGAWDIWWHEAVGRESFFTPPHLMIQAAILAAIGAALYGWYRTRERAWVRHLGVLLLAPLSAPLDDFWHRTFGVENLATPLAVWSPPHLMLIASILGGFLLLLPRLHRYRGISSQQVFGGFAFAGILWLLTLVVAPIHPRGPFELLGFWGAGISAVVFAGVILVAQKWMPGLAEATLVIAFFLLPFLMVTAAHRTAPHVLVNPHVHPPDWVTVFAYWIPAVAIDIVRRPSLPIRGAVAGFFWAAVLYGLSSQFAGPALQYTISDAFVAIIASVIGGFIAGRLVERFAGRYFSDR